MKNHLLLKTLVLLIIFIISVNISAQSIEKGFQHYKNGEYKQAVELFKKLIEKKKEIIPAKYGLALAYSDDNNPKPKYKSAYRAVSYIEKKYPKFSQKERTRYASYGIDKQSLSRLKQKIITGALQEAYQSGSVEKIDDFSAFYKDSIAVAKAQQYRYELIFDDCMKRNIVEVYQDFARKYPEAPQADSARKLADSLMAQKYKEIANEGDYQALLQFKADYPEFKDMKRLNAEIENIYLVYNKLRLDKPFREENMSAYVQFIKKAAPSELAFVALQRILTKSLQEKNRKETIDSVK
jgi:hypothetical protein